MLLEMKYDKITMTWLRPEPELTWPWPTHTWTTNSASTYLLLLLLKYSFYNNNNNNNCYLLPNCCWCYSANMPSIVFPSQRLSRYSQKALIFPLITGEWTHLRPHACYRLKWGTKRSARRCSIRWYQRRPSYSTMATNARRSILNLSRNLSRNFLSLKSQLLHNS